MRLRPGSLLPILASQDVRPRASTSSPCRRISDRLPAGLTQEEVEQCVGSWVAHAAHADTWRLRRAIFRGGWFDPLYQPP